MAIEQFRMERYQSLHWHAVDYDLSESGVSPMTIRDLLGPTADAESVLATKLGYPLSEGSDETRANVATWYPGATAENVTMVNGGSEANFLALWALLEPGDRLAFMVPNYMQGWGLGRFFGGASDQVPLLAGGRWQLDVDQLRRAVTDRTKAVMVCNPNNPTGHVLSDEEMDEVVRAADRVGAWIVADEIYRGAELDTDVASPTFFGRYERVIVTSGLSKAFAMPGLRVGWVVAPASMISRIWERHDYTTLTPSAVSDRLAAFAMSPDEREAILSRTRTIVRGNYPRLEAWLDTHAGVFTWERPRCRRDRLRDVRPADRERRARGAHPTTAQRAARAGRHVRPTEGASVRLRLRHRAHAEGTVARRRGVGRDRRSPIGGRVEPVAHAADRADAVVPDLLAQVPDVDVDDVGARVVVEPPYPAQQLLTAEHLAGVAEEGLGERELACRELDLPAVDTQPAGAQIEHQSPASSVVEVAARSPRSRARTRARSSSNRNGFVT